jgi:hypothetical protein
LKYFAKFSVSFWVEVLEESLIKKYIVYVGQLPGKTECSLLLCGKRMAQSDWLLTGQDFPVLPTGNTLFLLPWLEDNHKKL